MCGYVYVYEWGCIVIRNYSERWLWAAKRGCWELNSHLLEDQHIFYLYYLLLSWLLVVLGVESRALPCEVSTLSRIRNLSLSLNKFSVCLLQLYRQSIFTSYFFLLTAVFRVLLFLIHACIFTHITSRRTMLVLILTHESCARSREQSPFCTVRSLP